LVHRDITPSNIMVTYTGAPKLVDFGIARAAQRLTETKPGVVKGKLLYAAPEQYSSRQADARTDLYGLAICLYEMLVGENPFAAAQTPFEAAGMVAKQTPASVLGVRPDVPRKLADAIAAGLEKEPAKRPQSAGEFRRRLEAAIASANAVVGMPELARWMAQLYPGRAALDHTRHSEAKEEVPTQREQLAGAGATLPLRVTPEKVGAVLVAPPGPPAKHDENAAPVLMPMPQALRHSGAPFASPAELPPDLPTKIEPGSDAAKDERSRSPTEGEVPIQPVSTPEQVARARASISRLPHAGAPPHWSPGSPAPAPHQAKEFPAADPQVSPDAPTLEPPPNYPAAVLGAPRHIDVRTVPLKPDLVRRASEIAALDEPPVRTRPDVSPPADTGGTTGSTTLPQTRRASRWPRRLVTAVVVLAALGASAYGAVQLRRRLETPAAQRVGP
ncbi:MAG TPA: protein kinase, partial [Myxococcaceae bacterium]|nr:protein kinase [Myxococcaceae bacterium]